MNQNLGALIRASLIGRKQMARRIARTERFSGQADLLAEKLGRSPKSVLAEATRMLGEIVAVQNHGAGDLLEVRPGGL